AYACTLWFNAVPHYAVPISGEAARRACEKLKKDLEGSSLTELEGREYLGEYLAKTDAMGSDVRNPVSNVAYGYATQVCILNEDRSEEHTSELQSRFDLVCRL